MEFWPQLTQTILEGVGQACRPLVQKVNGALHPLGSCVLFASDQNVFLATASHVLKSATDVRVVVPGGIAQIEGRAFGSFADGPDRTDFAVIQLSERCRGWVASAPLLSPSDLDLNEDAHLLPGRDYVVQGYPASRVEILGPTAMSFEPFMLTTRAVETGAYAVLGRRDPMHLLVRFDPKSIRKKLGRTPPKLEGVSGGAVWAVNRDAQSVKLVALAIERSKVHRAIVAVRVGLPVEFIREHAPDAVASIPRARRFCFGAAEASQPSST